MIRKEYEYRRNAIASMELARRAASPADKAHLLKLAETWLELANLIHSQSGQRVRKIGEHPLVRAKLGDTGQPDTAWHRHSHGHCRLIGASFVHNALSRLISPLGRK